MSKPYQTADDSAARRGDSHYGAASVQGVPMILDMPASQYHADFGRVSHSLLERFREDPALYQSIITGQIAESPTPAMVLGQLVHAFVLEPITVGQRFTVIPKSRAKDVVESHDEKVAFGYTPVTVAAMDLANAIRNAIDHSPLASRWLRGQAEQTLQWTDAEADTACKARLDIIGRSWIADLKTASDPSAKGFAKQAASFGYHRQAAWYIDGFKQITGIDVPFIFVAVGKDSPHTVCAYQLNEDAIELGREQNRRDLWRLAECRRTGVWRLPESLQVMDLELPKWAQYEGEYNA